MPGPSFSISTICFEGSDPEDLKNLQTLAVCGYSGLLQQRFVASAFCADGDRSPNTDHILRFIVIMLKT